MTGHNENRFKLSHYQDIQKLQAVRIYTWQYSLTNDWQGIIMTIFPFLTHYMYHHASSWTSTIWNSINKLAETVHFQSWDIILALLTNKFKPTGKDSYETLDFQWVSLELFASLSQVPLSKQISNYSVVQKEEHNQAFEVCYIS
jgi:hypothetical protein